MMPRCGASFSQTRPRHQPSCMNLAKDFLNLSEIVAPVPRLATACSLAVNIIVTVQKSTNNNARLRRLAHSIANDLVGIADCMERRWDDAPAKLGDHLQEFEGILAEVLRVVTKYSRSSLVARAIALVNAEDREMEIDNLERRVSDAQKSVLLLVGLETALTVAQIHNQGRVTHATLLGLIEDSRNRREVSEPRTLGNSGVYARDNVALLRKILPRRTVNRDGKQLLYVTLHEAERRTDGSMVLVKTYEGPKQHRAEVFLTNLKFHADHWDSSILQLVGASNPDETVPFEVYHLPNRQTESFGDWIGHSVRSNLVGTILGLYDMRKSVQDLLDFQRQNSVRFSRKIFRSSLVTVQGRRGRNEWSLVYAGELLTTSSVKVDSSYKTFRSLRWDPLVLNSDKCPKRTLIASFAGGVNHWVGDTRHLDSIIDESMDFHKLASVLFQNSYLGDCGGVVSPRDKIALGDVGYVDEEGFFMVVGNLHDKLLSRDGRSPTWEKTKLSYGSGIVLKDEKTIVGPSNKTFNRSECTIVNSKSEAEVGVAYKDLDDRHAWNIFQRSVCEIIFRKGLSVDPHDLKLVHSIEYFIYMTLRTQDASPSDNTSAPSVYLFENGDAVQVQNFGAPALTGRLRPTFNAEPTWLEDEEAWRMNSGEEQRDKIEMEYTSEHMAFYIQLPPSIAAPYVADKITF